MNTLFCSVILATLAGSVASPAMLEQTTYGIRNATSGMAVDISGDSAANGTAVVQWPFGATNNQIWQVAVADDSNSYVIMNPNFQTCLDVASLSLSSGGQIDSWTCNRGANQKWLPQAQPDGSYSLVNVNSGLCLDVPQASTTLGTALDQNVCNDGNAQRWNFVPPESPPQDGFVLLTANANNAVTGLSLDMTVPPEPLDKGELFLWPGLQPAGANYEPIGLGVLQPVLTWGTSCAPGNQPAAYSSWWISAQYVNSNKDPNHSGCLGGAVMSVDVGDTLSIEMALNGTIWTQVITDTRTEQSVSFSLDMQGQAQNQVIFSIEKVNGAAPVSDVHFTNILWTLAESQPGACAPNQHGTHDYVAPAVVSADPKSCSISSIILRAAGVPATSADPGD